MKRVREVERLEESRVVSAVTKLGLSLMQKEYAEIPISSTKASVKQWMKEASGAYYLDVAIRLFHQHKDKWAACAGNAVKSPRDVAELLVRHLLSARTTNVALASSVPICSYSIRIYSEDRDRGRIHFRLRKVRHRTNAAAREKLNILHEEPGFVVLDKPHGVLSVPGIKEKDSILCRVEHMYPDAPVRIVHRLDQETSGVMIVALDKNSAQRLGEKFEKKEMVKEYVAVCSGKIEADSGVITVALRPDENNRPKQVVDLAHGKPCTTEWQVLDRQGEHCTRVLLRPLTGRTHQLRVHMNSIGHTILGDSLYGDETSREYSRLHLHAQSLLFNHPDTNQELCFFSACPF